MISEKLCEYVGLLFLGGAISIYFIYLVLCRAFNWKCRPHLLANLRKSEWASGLVIILVVILTNEICRRL